MHSKNKRPMDADEREHVTRVKELSCGVCDASAPSHAHEIVQGQWFTSMPLCDDCHTGPHNGIHFLHRIWDVKKLDELKVLNNTIRRLYARSATTA